MSKRTYRKYTDVQEEFRSFLRARREENVFLAPPERTLAELLGASRMTVRKVLAEAEIDGLIRRDGHQTHILPEPSLERCGRITCFLGGQGQTVALPAFERLWLMLEPRLRGASADIRLFLVNDQTGLGELTVAAAESEVIMLGIIDHEPFVRHLKEIQGHKCVIALSDPWLEQFDKVIALDNYAVGTMAAETLWQAGSRRAAICGGFDHPIFNKRLQGFSDRLPRLGGELHRYPFPPKEITRKIPDCASSLVDARERGIDGIFIQSDEWMDEITAPVYRIGGIPERFKILSFNGSGDFMRCKPVVSVLNHGTRETVEAILEYLETSAAKSCFGPIKILIKPHLYKNQTIG
jgi:DNA-binding LacI/PurR family transcriptional regulator